MSGIPAANPRRDFRSLLRTWLRHALASNSLVLVRMVFAGAVLIYLAHLVQIGRAAEAVVVGVLSALIILLLGAGASAFQNWTDRKFFRDAYHAELILSELARSVSSIHNRKTLIETVSRRLEESLHPVSLALLSEREGAYTIVYSSGANLREPASIQGSGSLVRMLKLQNGPAKVYFDDPQSWVYGLPELESSLLSALQTQVLIPVTVDSRLLAILSLGAKHSGTAYTRADLQLLSAVASQAGFALENIRLTENIREEIARRERLNRELEIAREVQQRLFPQILPYVPGLDFAGYCRPALGVGGDYYDFIRLDNGSLGMAIGDVSGKGIAAALMMASLQASLRAQLIRPCETLAEMIQNVNRLVYEASSENRYATFFYAQYEPQARRLHYVNAGHNAPMLVRSDTGQVRRLDDGGMVLGVFPQAPYSEGSLSLVPGDVLVGFTDGISEAMNAREEEFGEERLMEAIARTNARSAADLIASILGHADAFTGGAPQHDDMTLLVVRVR